MFRGIAYKIGHGWTQHIVSQVPALLHLCEFRSKHQLSLRYSPFCVVLCKNSWPVFEFQILHTVMRLPSPLWGRGRPWPSSPSPRPPRPPSSSCFSSPLSCWPTTGYNWHRMVPRSWTLPSPSPGSWSSQLGQIHNTDGAGSTLQVPAITRL